MGQGTLDGASDGNSAMYIELSHSKSRGDRDDEELKRLGKKPVLKVRDRFQANSIILLLIVFVQAKLSLAIHAWICLHLNGIMGRRTSVCPSLLAS